jgi:hypothetical protein
MIGIHEGKNTIPKKVGPTALKKLQLRPTTALSYIIRTSTTIYCCNGICTEKL